MFKVLNLPGITIQRGITDLNISHFISIPFIFLVCFCSNFQFLLYILSLSFCICIYICILFSTASLKSLFPKAFQWMVAFKLFSTQFWKFQWFGIFIYSINWLVPVNSPHIPELNVYLIVYLIKIVILIKILADVLSSYSYQWWMVC